jgi:hypothetical protein
MVGVWKISCRVGVLVGRGVIDGEGVIVGVLAGVGDCVAVDVGDGVSEGMVAVRIGDGVPDGSSPGRATARATNSRNMIDDAKAYRFTENPSSSIEEGYHVHNSNFGHFFSQGSPRPLPEPRIRPPRAFSYITLLTLHAYTL